MSPAQPRQPSATNVGTMARGRQSEPGRGQRRSVDELSLLDLASRGDRAAYGEIVQSRLDRAYRMATAILGNEPDARDAVQEAFTAAWMNLPKLRDAERFDAWFGRILMNQCRDAIRRRRRSREVSIDGLAVSGSETSDPDPQLSRLAAAFELLSVEQRELLVRHHLHHEAIADIAVRLGIPGGTVKSRLYGARQALERALENQR